MTYIDDLFPTVPVNPGGARYDTQEDRPMSSIRRRTLERRIAQLEEELARIEVADALLPEFDPFGDGDIVAFDRDHGSSGIYSYAALRADGRWYLTGTRSRAAYTWTSLRDLLASDDVDPESIYVVTEWHRLDQINLGVDEEDEGELYG